MGWRHTRKVAMIGSLFVTGPAGTGKSTLCGALKEWFIKQEYDVAVVNLDPPGSEFVPYEPDVDVREIISLPDVMSEFNLGPNGGAQIVASDLMLENVDKMQEYLSEFNDYYVIFDTPGQIELFAFRQGSPMLVDKLSGGRAMLAFVTDAVLSTSPSGLVSQMMLYGSVFSRFYKPMLYIVNKTDLIGEDDLDEIKTWFNDSEELRNALFEERQEMLKDYLSGVITALQDSGMFSEIIPVSSRDFTGLEDIYSKMSLFFEGGADTDTLYRDD